MNKKEKLIKSLEAIAIQYRYHTFHQNDQHFMLVDVIQAAIAELKLTAST